ncbi:DUF4974 domain-containing protein [Muricauda sp. TY007]|uniref:FecR family protein n=1 Tax=Allomuricauda sp. TY007 TaxID=2683200 RepID=UPI0013C1F554|nr:FecR domain-containing protein [Muricauda sp. TY007]NDV17491.1 DUF4974 domain-containing protein [Muricauda sp. TY007]
MKTEAFIKILERYSKNEASREEIVLIDTYLEGKAGKNKGKASNIEKVHDRLYGQIEASLNKNQKVVPFKTVYRKWAIAASILVVFGTFFFAFMDFSVKVVEVTTAYGERKEIQLPDGTMVTLNAGSRLRYPEKFKGDRREVALNGEAFFDVFRDTLKPFTIETGKLRTQVLGTSFNINAFQESDSIRVSVVEGKVVVYDSMAVKEILLPNEQLKYNKVDKGYRTSKYDSSIDRAWSSNIIYFNGTSLEEATHILERWYNVTIEITDADLGDKVITGKYNDPKLKETMESLGFLMNIEFKQLSPTLYEVTPIKKAPM